MMIRSEFLNSGFHRSLDRLVWVWLLSVPALIAVSLLSGSLSLNLPRVSCIPTPGPVAYHPQEGFLTCPVMSRGFVQVSPSSAEIQTAAVGREPEAETFPAA